MPSYHLSGTIPLHTWKGRLCFPLLFDIPPSTPGVLSLCPWNSTCGEAHEEISFWEISEDHSVQQIAPEILPGGPNYLKGNWLQN
jgi:hypothetical protein